MKYLVDTNVLLWLFMGDKRLSHDTRELLEVDSAACAISVVSLWEVATKQSIGKLNATLDINGLVTKHRFGRLGLANSHIEIYRQLPLIHRDPFDRMLIAQALDQKLTVLTSDAIFGDYPGLRVISALK